MQQINNHKYRSRYTFFLLLCVLMPHRTRWLKEERFALTYWKSHKDYGDKKRASWVANDFAECFWKLEDLLLWEAGVQWGTPHTIHSLCSSPSSDPSSFSPAGFLPADWKLCPLHGSITFSVSLFAPFGRGGCCILVVLWTMVWSDHLARSVLPCDLLNSKSLERSCSIKFSQCSSPSTSVPQWIVPVVSYSQSMS